MSRVGVVWLWVSAVASAQAEAARQATFIQVENLGGEPVAGAVVTLAGSRPHLGGELAADDVLQLATDVRGRAQARLLPGLCYVGWAIGSADAGGAAAVSNVFGWFAAGGLVRLTCTHQEPTRRLRVTGLAAWSDAPLRFLAWTRRPGPSQPLELVDDAVLLPPGPWSAIEVATADGAPLWCWTRFDDPLALPPPQNVAVHVVDERGQALPGVPVRHRVARQSLWQVDGFGGVGADRWRELGRTDADGRCVVRLPYPNDPLTPPRHGDLVLFAAAEGRPAVAGGIYQGALFCSDRKMAPGPVRELEFVCRSPSPLAGNVGSVPSGTVAHLAAVCKLFLGESQYHQDARSFIATVGADGSFVFNDVPAELHACRLTLLPPPGSPAAMPLLPARAGRELVELLDPVRGPGLLSEGVVDIDLQVLDPNGGPARGLVGHLVPVGDRSLLARDALIRVPLDARGTAQLRLLPGTWALLVLGESGYAAELLALEPGAGARQLRMEPLPQMQVELLGDGGGPIAGASVVVRRTSTKGTGDPLQSLLQGLCRRQRDHWERLRTDAAGRLAIPFVPVAGTQQLVSLRWHDGETEEFALVATTPSAAPQRLRLR